MADGKGSNAAKDKQAAEAAKKKADAAKKAADADPYCSGLDTSGRTGKRSD